MLPKFVQNPKRNPCNDECIGAKMINFKSSQNKEMIQGFLSSGMPKYI